MKHSEVWNLPKELCTDPLARPIYLEGGKEAILLIHGFTGIPGDLAFLAQRLHAAGYTVAVPRLPGHGTRGEDFLTTRAEDWFRKVVDSYTDLKERFHTIHWVGLSMGALLSIMGRAQFHSGALVLAAPALKVKDRRLWLTPLLRHFTVKMRKKGYTYQGEPEYRPLSESYWQFNWPVQAAELYKLQRLAHRALAHVRGNILVLLAAKDDTVPPTVLELIQKNAPQASIQANTFYESGHVLLNDVERGLVAGKIIDWLKQQR